MDIGHLVTLLRGTLQPDERVEAEKQLIEVCRSCCYLYYKFHFNYGVFNKVCMLCILFEVS